MPSSLRQLSRAFRSGTIPTSGSTKVSKARYNPAQNLRKENIAGVRDGMKIIKKAAKAFEGSPLKKRTGRTARTIGTRVRGSKSSAGIHARIFGWGYLNVWKNGRKEYTIRPVFRKALSTPEGPRKSVTIKAQEPRRVLEPAVDAHRGDVEKCVAARMEKAASEGITRTIKFKAGR